MPEIVRKKKYDRTTSLILVILSQTYSSGLLRSNMHVHSFKARSLINHHHAWIIWSQYTPTALVGTSKERDCVKSIGIWKGGIKPPRNYRKFSGQSMHYKNGLLCDKLCKICDFFLSYFKHKLFLFLGFILEECSKDKLNHTGTKIQHLWINCIKKHLRCLSTMNFRRW